MGTRILVVCCLVRTVIDDFASKSILNTIDYLGIFIKLQCQKFSGFLVSVLIKLAHNVAAHYTVGNGTKATPIILSLLSVCISLQASMNECTAISECLMRYPHISFGLHGDGEKVLATSLQGGRVLRHIRIRSSIRSPFDNSGVGHTDAHGLILLPPRKFRPPIRSLQAARGNDEIDAIVPSQETKEVTALVESESRA
ncbi:hypothetical protein B0H34DRAFT_673527 [Crassisporium funariophilum]|nr:hypothetical protein B0H34DRAFT_673527 [Crassisporium funariophilum]